MLLFLLVLLLVAMGVLLIPIVVLSVECMAASFPSRPSGHQQILQELRPRFAVLIPAHNEAGCLGATLASIMPQLGPDDYVLVVADNCTDDTATVAASAGARVRERNDAVHKGKGFALEFGLSQMEADPPGVVIQIDADSTVHPGSLEALALMAASLQLPVQAVNLLDPPVNAATGPRVSAFAFRVKNLVRPLGLGRLGLPCLLTTGVAYPWSVIRVVSLGSGNLVEDMQVGIDLAIAGYPARLCPSARVTGILPGVDSAADTQRTRWEHGHLQTMLTQVPRLLAQGIGRGSPKLLGLALELAVPPLSLLVLVWIVLSAAAVVGTMLAAWRLPMILAVFGWVLLVTSIGSAWWRFARDLLPFKTLLFIPLYMLGKIPRFVAFVTRRQREWVRTARET